jgi:hypothetical protein
VVAAAGRWGGNGAVFVRLRALRGSGDPFALRVTQVREPNARGELVVYHVRSARRTESNLALDFARSFRLPLVVSESPGEEDLRRAKIVVTDEFPTLPTPPHATHLVDDNGILPMRAMEKEQYSAKFFRDRAFRMFERFWIDTAPADVPLDFLEGYAAMHNKSPKQVSGLSPAIHRGEIGARELVAAVLQSDAPDEDVDAFLEQLIIRRELSFNLCFYNPRHASLDALPQWAKDTLDKHRGDRRKPSYTLDELEAAATHDEVWNLSQRQLVACGTIHGYLRMLWGKKIIEWSATPEDAHAAMVELHERYAHDAIDPNTHAGILWCFGKHDRPWAPERPIFGSIRWMSSDQTAKKVRLREVEESVAACGEPAVERAKRAETQRSLFVAE